MSLFKQYTGVEVVNDFEQVDELYKQNSLLIDLSIQKSLEGIILNPNLNLVLKNGKQSVLGVVKDNHIVKIPENIKVHNITYKNKEQHMAINMLLDPEVDLVCLSGSAGSGKTLLALAFAWQQLKNDSINKIVLGKSLTTISKDIGYLKGDLFQKMLPRLGNYMDNFEVLGVPEYEIAELIGQVEPNTTKMKKTGVKKSIEIMPIAFIQGRSLRNSIIILDEAQQLPPDVIKQIVTRAGENVKVILLGDFSQIFDSKMSATNNGLFRAIQQGRDCPHVASINMIKSQRSRIAQWAIDFL